jgi:hypothetical protein
VSECGRGGTGGGEGGAGRSIRLLLLLFDEDGRAEPSVIDRDLRNVIDSLRRRAPAEVPDLVTDGAGEDDGGLAGEA